MDWSRVWVMQRSEKTAVTPDCWRRMLTVDDSTRRGNLISAIRYG